MKTPHEIARETELRKKILDSLYESETNETEGANWGPCIERIMAALTAASAEQAKALNDATTSLCTIAQQAGRTEELREMGQVRGYAFSRYSAAIDAARAQEGKA